MILTMLVVGAFPGLPTVAQQHAHRSAQQEQQHEGNGTELTEAEPAKACAFRQRRNLGTPTCDWLVLRMPRSRALRLQSVILDYEDPRRVLLPPRIDPPPDGQA